MLVHTFQTYSYAELLIVRVGHQHGGLIAPTIFCFTIKEVWGLRVTVGIMNSGLWSRLAFLWQLWVYPPGTVCHFRISMDQNTS